MVSPFALVGCLLNLVIGGICVFVHQRRAGRDWLLYAAAFHLVNAVIYALLMSYQPGPELQGHIRSASAIPLFMIMMAHACLTPATVLAMFGRWVAPRRIATIAVILAVIDGLVAWLVQPMAGYLLAHGLLTISTLVAGSFLTFGSTAFYRITGISFLGRGLYSVLIIYFAAYGAPSWAYETSVTINLVFICLTGLGFILIELDDARAHIAEANHAKTMFIANMSHELRTPLNAIIGFSEMIESEHFALPIERCRGYATHVLTSARHLLSVINQLLDMASIEARDEALAPEDVCLDELIATSVSMLTGEAAAKGVMLRVEKPNQPTMLMADPRALRQIILCLAGNAVKFSQSGTAVSVILNTDDNTGRIILAVRDQGPGIETGHLQKIFEPFWQVQHPYRRSKGGVGLGLSIARNLARGLGGDITVDSKPGRGSQFTVDLPRSMPLPTAMDRLARLGRPGQPKPKPAE
jgi:signal transduction histidine kinase